MNVTVVRFQTNQVLRFSADIFRFADCVDFFKDPFWSQITSACVIWRWQSQFGSFWWDNDCSYLVGFTILLHLLIQVNGDKHGDLSLKTSQTSDANRLVLEWSNAKLGEIWDESKGPVNSVHSFVFNREFDRYQSGLWNAQKTLDIPTGFVDSAST